MDRLSQMRMFVEVVKQQGFAPAARALGVTNSAISKSIGTLEDDLGIRLLQRTTRKLSLTHEGALYYERCLRILDDVKEAEALVLDMQQRPSGALKINAPLTFGINNLSAIFARFAKEYPEIILEVDLDDRYVDVVQEGYDLVIRIAALPDSSLISRKLCTAPLHWVASAAYTAEHGLPDAPDALKSHRVIGYTRHGQTVDWKYKTLNGATGHLTLTPHTRTNNGEMMLALVMADAGIGLIPEFILNAHPESKSLVRCLETFPTEPERNVYAVFSQKKHLSLKVRTLLDYLTKELGA